MYQCNWIEVAIVYRPTYLCTCGCCVGPGVDRCCTVDIADQAASVDSNPSNCWNTSHDSVPSHRRRRNTEQPRRTAHPVKHTQIHLHIGSNRPRSGTDHASDKSSTKILQHTIHIFATTAIFQRVRLLSKAYFKSSNKTYVE